MFQDADTMKKKTGFRLMVVIITVLSILAGCSESRSGVKVYYDSASVPLGYALEKLQETIPVERITNADEAQLVILCSDSLSRKFGISNRFRTIAEEVEYDIEIARSSKSGSIR